MPVTPLCELKIFLSYQIGSRVADHSFNSANGVSYRYAQTGDISLRLKYSLQLLASTCFLPAWSTPIGV